jgi:hypothetical protein
MISAGDATASARTDSRVINDLFLEWQSVKMIDRG